METNEVKTERGFQVVEFKDYYTQQCSIQQSSIALYDKPGSGALWIGCDSGKRMHLSKSQVEDLIIYLEQWTKTGELF